VAVTADQCTELPVVSTVERRRIKFEIFLLLALSLGRSGVYSVVNLIGMLTDSVPLADQVATLNPVRSPRPYLDLTYQLLAIGFALVPVLLAWHFLAVRRGRPTPGQLFGFSSRSVAIDGSLPASCGRWLGREAAWGLALFAAVGIPGLTFYGLGRLLGITVAVEASALDPHWWTIPVLILSALQNGILEEVIVVGYLFERTRDLGWSQGVRFDWRFLAFSALLRGSYHLYQGVGPFLGNVVMGLFFAWWFLSRFGRHRLLPLIIAHWLLDVVAFVGYALAPPALLRLLGF
jgi:hypothetical protein